MHNKNVSCTTIDATKPPLLRRLSQGTVIANNLDVSIMHCFHVDVYSFVRFFKCNRVNELRSRKHRIHLFDS